MQDVSHIASDLKGVLAKYLALPHTVANPALDEVRTDVAAMERDRISYDEWCTCLEAIHEAAQEPHLGQTLGALIEPAHCGVLGYLSLSCDTLGEAFVRFERYQRLLYSGTPGQASVMDNGCLRFQWPFHDSSLGISISDEVLVFGMMSFVQRLLGAEQARPTVTGFFHTPLAPVASYQRALGGEVRFGCDALFVEIEAHWLLHPISDGDPALKVLLEQQANTLMNVIPSDEGIEDIRKHLMKAMQDGEPTLNRLASSLCMSSRTLHRRLSERGHNFASLLKETRMSLARQYLRDQRLELSEVALLLGYSEQSAFSRAFRSWMDMTPSQYLASLATYEDSSMR